MLRRHAMKPDRGVTGADLAVNGVPSRVPRDATAREAEGIDEEVVSRGDVLVGQNGNDSLDTRHDVLLGGNDTRWRGVGPTPSASAVRCHGGADPPARAARA